MTAPSAWSGRASAPEPPSTRSVRLADAASRRWARIGALICCLLVVAILTGWLGRLTADPAGTLPIPPWSIGLALLSSLALALFGAGWMARSLLKTGPSRLTGAVTANEHRPSPVSTDSLSPFPAAEHASSTGGGPSTEGRRQPADDLQGLLNTLPGVVFRYRLDADGVQRFLSLSRGTEALLGIGHERLTATYGLFWDRIVPQDVPPFREAVRLSAETASPASFEFRLRAQDGSVKWIRWQAAPQPPETDGSVTWHGLMAEVTDLKRTDDRQAKIHAALSAFGNEADENIGRLTEVCGSLLGATMALYHRLEQGTLRTVGRWNVPEGFAVQGDPNGSVCGDAIRRASDRVLVVRDLPRTAYAQTDPMLHGTALRTAVGKVVFCGGEVVGALCLLFDRNMVPTDPDETVLGLLAASIGGEELRRRTETALGDSEEQVRRLQRMDAISRLAGGIAHEFNNLLTTVVGHGRLLLQAADVRSPSRQPLAEMTEAADRAAALTRHLLAFSRKQPRELQRLVLNDIVAAQAPLLQSMLGERHRILTDLSPSVSPVLADAIQLEQVLLHLCLNARDAMPTGGTITLRTSTIQVAPPAVERQLRSRPGAYVILAVEDQGTGMDEFVQAHCFEPFFTTKPRTDATGLGLSTVYGIMKQNEGTVTVDSAVGRGTTMTLYWPQAEAPFQPISRKKDEAADVAGQGQETVLLVEDDMGLRTVLARVLGRQGYRVLDASSGAAAMGLASRHGGPIHVLVTDLVMPELSGLDLARLLKPTRPGMKVIYISGYPDTSVVQPAVNDLQAVLLQKPFGPEALLRTVRSVLDAEEPAG